MGAPRRRRAGAATKPEKNRPLCEARRFRTGTVFDVIGNCLIIAFRFEANGTRLVGAVYSSPLAMPRTTVNSNFSLFR
jgi:hypothetical protein